MSEELRHEIASLRTDHKLLAQRVDTVDSRLLDLRQDLDKKHKENRDSIHELRNNDQTILEALHGIQSFFSENGALPYMKKKMEDTDTQNKWIIGLLLSMILGVGAVLVELVKH